MNAIATKLPTRAQFESRLSKVKGLQVIVATLRAQFASQYGPGWNSTWLSASNRRQYDTASARLSKAEDVFFDTLQAVASRNWRSGIPVAWILDNVTWEMATTLGPISPVPPLAWGHSGNNAIWAQALK